MNSKALLRPQPPSAWLLIIGLRWFALKYRLIEKGISDD